MDWSGNSTMIWQVKMSTGNYPANSQEGWNYLVKKVQDVGFVTCPVKVADGVTVFNQTEQSDGTWKDDILDGLYDTFEANGIERTGWQYIYGNAPKGESDRAVRMIRRLKLTKFIIDAESEYKGKTTAAETYMKNLVAMCPDVSFALCSFRFPKLHPEFPWSNFLKYFRKGKDIHYPQVYWEQATSPMAGANQLKTSYDQLKEVKDLEIYPVGAAYGAQGTIGYWSPTVEQQNNFAKMALDLGMAGVSWWELGTMLRPDFIKRGYYNNMPNISAMFGGNNNPPPQPTHPLLDPDVKEAYRKLKLAFEEFDNVLWNNYD